jgi:Ca-activated chloride channel family protein
MFSSSAYDNARPGGMSVLMVDGDPPRFVPLKRTELRGVIAGPLAALRLVQTFGYTRVQHDGVLEAIYRFPLPGDAAISAVRVTFGDVAIEAHLAERRQAEQEYQAARAQGRQAALLSREAPDVFSLQVAGLMPDQLVTVETRYVQLARAEGPGWSLRLPLTTAPRYARADEAGTPQAEGRPLALLRDPGHLFLMDLRILGAVAVQSATHPLQPTAEDDAIRVQLRGGHVVPDRDLVLEWTLRQEEERPALQLWTHRDTTADQTYLLAGIAPPRRNPDRPTPREVILLVDHSGSMEGAKWEAADWTVTQFLAGLGPEDRVNLAVFHSTTRWFAPEPRTATPRLLAEIRGFLEVQRDSGGTELGIALEQALRMRRQKGAYARHVLLITDAEVTDAGRILRLADEEWRRPDHRRISLLCIDAAPNSFLASEVAERGGGLVRFLTSDPAQEDIATALDAVLADWAQPVLAGLRLVVDRPDVETTGRHSLSIDAAHAAIDLGDLPAGRALWAMARVAGTTPVHCRLEAGEPALPPEPAVTSTEGRQLPALKPLFGARRVLGLEFLSHAHYREEQLREQLRRLGYDPDRELVGDDRQASTVYAENVRAAQEHALEGLLVRDALAYGLASSKTAFVATRAERGRQVEARVLVANALPEGWTGRLPTGSTGGMVPAPPGFRAMAAMPDIAAIPQSMPPQGRSLPGRLADRFSGLAGRRQPGPAPHAPGASPQSGRADVSGGGAQDASAVEVFRGHPQLSGGATTLFDSVTSSPAPVLPPAMTLRRLSLRFLEDTPSPIDGALRLLLFVNDPAAPRAQVGMADLARQGGGRPLHIAARPGERIWLVLRDPSGVWASAAPAMSITLEWSS